MKVIYSCLLVTKLLTAANALVLEMSPTQNGESFHRLEKVSLCFIHFTAVIKRNVTEIKT